jgi:hypothetical protein
MKNKKTKSGKSKSIGSASAKPVNTDLKQGVKLNSISTQMLAAELQRRQSELPKLVKYAAALRSELAGVEAHIVQLGGGASAGTLTSSTTGTKPGPKTGAKPGPKPGAKPGPKSAAKPGPKPAVTVGKKRGPKPGSRPARVMGTRKGKPTLSAQVATTLSDRGVVMSPSEIAESVARRNNRAVNGGFLVQISSALRQLVNAAVITQVSRGKYCAKGPVVVAEA